MALSLSFSGAVAGRRGKLLELRAPGRRGPGPRRVGMAERSEPDLSVKVNGLEMPNPFVIGSGPPGTNYTVMKRAFDEGWAPLSPRPFAENDVQVSLDAAKVVNVTPRYARLRAGSNGSAKGPVIGWENIELISDRPLEMMLNEFKQLKQEYPDRILIASIMEEYSKDAWQELIEWVEETVVDALEINFSCPHGMPERKMGAAVGQDCELLEEVCGWINEKATVPVWAKMTPNITGITKGVRVICSKRGGSPSTSSHCEWLLTIPSMPDVINFTFVPITSLLKGVPGTGFLAHAINLYQRYKPPISDLQYFLDFQHHKAWAPMLIDLPLGPCSNRAITTPAPSFNVMGPKLYVNTTQVVVRRLPVTGMRLHLEGKKNNRLAVHLQHLASTPVFIGNQSNKAPQWRGSDAIADERYYEAVQWKMFSHACTAPVEDDAKWSADGNTAFIVTGAQLHVTAHESKSVLHLRLLFSEVPGCMISQSIWERGTSSLSQKWSGFLSTISTTFSMSTEKDNHQPPLIVVDSGVFPTGPPVPVQAQKLLKFVDTSHRCKGPQDSPGHWLVTGAKLDVEKGKIGLHVKFSLLTLIS